MVDLLKATPSFWRAKLVEGMRVNPMFITRQQVGGYLERKQKSGDPYGMSSLQGNPLKNQTNVIRLALEDLELLPLGLPGRQI